MLNIITVKHPTLLWIFQFPIHSVYRGRIRITKVLYVIVVWKQALPGTIPSIRTGEWELMRISPTIKTNCWIWQVSMRSSTVIQLIVLANLINHFMCMK